MTKKVLTTLPGNEMVKNKTSMMVDSAIGLRKKLFKKYFEADKIRPLKKCVVTTIAGDGSPGFEDGLSFFLPLLSGRNMRSQRK